MSNLRQQIIDTQKTRSEFLKWKLVAVAALGAVGLGLSQTPSAGPAHLILTLIPLVCFYTDQLWRSLTLRILLIGAYLRLDGSNGEQKYEQFAWKKGESLNMLYFYEQTVLEWSTTFLSLLVVIVGVLPQLLGIGQPANGAFRAFAIFSGAGSIILTTRFRKHFMRSSAALNRIQPVDLPISGVGIDTFSGRSESAPRQPSASP
jgi:hypothetical protein